MNGDYGEAGAFGGTRILRTLLQVIYVRQKN